MFVDAFPSAFTVSQNSFKAIGVNVEKIMALAEMNLKEVTALGITPFNFYFYAQKMFSPASDSSISESYRAPLFDFMKSWDGAEYGKQTVDLFGETDYELMLDWPNETMITRGQYDAAIWDDDVPLVVK
jgi:hypothetical protein